jgi:endoplasmic reticulum resident protein 44
LATRYQITKYPTLKFYLNGKMLKREYRGERNEKAIVDYVRELLSDPIVHIVFHDLDNFTSILYEHRAVICYQQKPPGNFKRYDMYRRVATDLRDYCKFYWVNKAPFLPENKEEMVAFKQPRTHEQSEYQNTFQNYDELSTWSISLCIPVVREINFKNAEEIIEENLPLVILFHHIDDQESVDWFKLVVHYELIRETSNVNFVTADGALFQHPLEHLGKTHKDLPLIAIDSFKHMYLFPHFQDLK